MENVREGIGKEGWESEASLESVSEGCENNSLKGKLWARGKVTGMRMWPRFTKKSQPCFDKVIRKKGLSTPETNLISAKL